MKVKFLSIGDYMKKQDKLNWIINYITEHGWQDVFMEEFVNSYVKECKPNKIEDTLWGANRVPELGRYLSELYKQGILKRFSATLNFQCDGFPKWCYGYYIKED